MSIGALGGLLIKHICGNRKQYWKWPTPQTRPRKWYYCNLSCNDPGSHPVLECVELNMPVGGLALSLESWLVWIGELYCDPTKLESNCVGLFLFCTYFLIITPVLSHFFLVLLSILVELLLSTHLPSTYLPCMESSVMIICQFSGRHWLSSSGSQEALFRKTLPGWLVSFLSWRLKRK